MAFIYPLDNGITQHFGANPYSPTQPWGHFGVDFGAPVGTPVRAIGPGVIRFADWNQKLGANPWWIIPGATGSGIFTALELDGGQFVQLSCHLSRTDHNPGQRVRQGEVIGYVGSTGNSTGPHLHLELINMHNINGHMYGRVDPLKYMSKVITAGQTQLAANQRLVGGANLSQRDAPNTGGKVVRVVPANTIEVFDGYVTGQEVNSGGVRSNIWYKDKQGYVWAGGFTSQATAGLANLTPLPALKPNQRKVGKAAANQRATPTITGKIVRTAAANTIEEFTGFVRGDAIEGNNVWFRDAIGFIWSGLFVDKSTKGLPDQTPIVQATKPTHRVVSPAGGIQRDAPRKSGKVVRNIPGNTLEEFSAYEHGEKVSSGGITTDIWFKDSQGYVWAGGFTSQSTNGLHNDTPQESQKPTPAPQTPAPSTPIEGKTKTIGAAPANRRTYPFGDADVQSVFTPGTIIEIDGWVEGDQVGISKVWFKLKMGGYVHVSTVTDETTSNFTKLATPAKPTDDGEPPYEFTPDFDFVEYKPANTWNMQNGNFPSKPLKVVIHQFDARDLNPSIDGVISHFQKKRPGKESSAHFAVSEDRIVQLVSLKDRAFHAGPVGNDYIGIEIDPDQDAKTVASVRKLLTAISAKLGYMPELTRHREVPETATLCGADVDLDLYRLAANTPKPTPTPEPTPTPGNPGQPSVITAAQKKAIIHEFFSEVMDDYIK